MNGSKGGHTENSPKSVAGGAPLHKVDVVNITRTFQRGFKAVDGLSFSFSSGEVVGFVGPNGAGKTTTMRILATLDVPDSGDVLLDGVSILDDPALAHRAIGFMPDELPDRADTTVEEYLDFFGRAYGLRARALASAIGAVVDFTGLGDFRGKTLRELSKGMKQRVSLARALVHDPQVVIMDEPANGLDPRARVELRELVRALAENGKALLVSSHILSELEEMCTTSVIIERGRRLSTDFADDGAWIRLRFGAASGGDVLARLLEMPDVREAEACGAGWRVRVGAGDEAAERLAQTLFARGLVPVHFASESGSLESVFMHVTKGSLA